jgi:hypothetical protein
MQVAAEVLETQLVHLVVQAVEEQGLMEIQDLLRD